MLRFSSSTPRFASSIRFVTEREWDSLPRHDFHSVITTDMTCFDQWIPAKKSRTSSLAPCIGGGLTRVQTDTHSGLKQGFVALCHLIPVYRADAEERQALVNCMTRSADNLMALGQQPMTQAPHVLKALNQSRWPDPAMAPKLKGCYVGGHAQTTLNQLWPTMVYGIRQAFGQNTYLSAFTNCFSTTPDLPKAVSAFVGQRNGGASNIAYDGSQDTWYILAYSVDRPKSAPYPVVTSLSTLRQHFKHRHVASDDQVYMGLHSTQPLPAAAIEGNTHDPYIATDPGWIDPNASTP